MQKAAKTSNPNARPKHECLVNTNQPKCKSSKAANTSQQHSLGYIATWMVHSLGLCPVDVVSGVRCV